MTEENSKGTYSENEIYQHITNCQVFLTYNADETKLLKRRKAFKESLVLLFNLTLRGNIAQANQWAITRALMGMKKMNPMIELGFKTAKLILEHESDAEKAAGILLFLGLDFAYNTVLAVSSLHCTPHYQAWQLTVFAKQFTSVLSELFGEIYKAAKSTTTSQAPRWPTIQKLAFSNDESDYMTLTDMVRQVACSTVRLPIVRKALKKCDFTTSTGEKWSILEHEIVYLDIVRISLSSSASLSLSLSSRPTILRMTSLANSSQWQANKDAISAKKEIPFQSLAVHSSIPEDFTVYHPNHLSDHGLASMIRLVAQMRNARRGHDTQGYVKKVRLDQTPEGYANFMAPMRMAHIAAQVRADKSHSPSTVYSPRVLRPGTDTYMTPTWDEMVPFPTTWKIRFDGFGASDYSSPDGKPFGKLAAFKLPDDAPPFYQPQSLSHSGGSFADCLCATGTCQCSAKHDEQGTKDGHDKSAPPTDVAARMPTLSAGCGLSK